MEEVYSSTPEEIKRIGNAEVGRQAADNRFVLDALESWNKQKGSPWHERLDVSHAGTFGHSLGGATSVETWATDPRVIAAMNMDGWTFGDQAITGRRTGPRTQPVTGKALMFLYEGTYVPFPDESEAQASGKSPVELEVDRWDAAHVRDLLQNYGGYWFQLKGADHSNFTDRPATSPLRRFAGGGAIDARLAHRIVRDYAVSFFSQTLLGKPSDLLMGDRGYAEIMTRPAMNMETKL
jgi:pimeloyl-ACP methyl ester carboxylesterase